MAWPLRRVLAKGVLINTTWNPLGSFRLFSWCLWPFQDCSYQTKRVFLKPKNWRGVWRADCMILFGQRRHWVGQRAVVGGQGIESKKKKKRRLCVFFIASSKHVVCEYDATQWAWIRNMIWPCSRVSVCEMTHLKLSTARVASCNSRWNTGVKKKKKGVWAQLQNHRTGAAGRSACAVTVAH